MSKNIKIAIDGPSSSGKGTLAKILSKKLNIMYIDTGAAYRAITYYFLSKNIEMTEENVNNDLRKINIEFTKDNLVYLNGIDVTDKLRSNEVSKYVSTVISRYKKVREKLIELFRKTAENNSVVMDGRDIGSVVFPNADLKLYIEVDVDIRAKRRYADYIAKNENVTLEEVKEQLIKRDDADMNGKNKGLVKVDDAITLYNNDSIEELVEKVMDILKIRNII